MLKHLDQLISKSVARKYSAGSTIIYQGEVPRSACILVSGTARVLSISTQGGEQTITYHVAGEFFPTSWIFGKATSALFFYDAVTDCEVAFVSRVELNEYMMATKERTEALLDYFTTEHSAALMRVNALEQPKARDKLMYTFYFLCQRYAGESSGQVVIPLMLTHQNIASLVGLTRETTATEMNKLKKQGILTYENQKYTVNIDKLVELIGEESFKSLKIGIK